MYSSQAKEASILILLFTIVVVTSGADLMADFSHGVDTAHIIKEAITVSISIVAIA